MLTTLSHRSAMEALTSRITRHLYSLAGALTCYVFLSVNAGASTQNNTAMWFCSDQQQGLLQEAKAMCSSAPGAAHMPEPPLLAILLSPQGISNIPVHNPLEALAPPARQGKRSSALAMLRQARPPFELMSTADKSLQHEHVLCCLKQGDATFAASQGRAPHPGMVIAAGGSMGTLIYLFVLFHMESISVRQPVLLKRDSLRRVTTRVGAWRGKPFVLPRAWRVLSGHRSSIQRA